MAESTGQPSSPLGIRATREGDVLVVGVSGELDMDTVPHVRAAVLDGLAATSSALVLDLTDVVFFGSPGLSLLLESRRRVGGADGHFAVVATRRAVLRPIELTALGPVLNVFPSVEQALAWVGDLAST